jgi:CDGSH iron-sulfur domain-containing protein 3
VIICHSVMAGTGKSDLLVNFSGMEESKKNKSQATIEVIDGGPLRISGNFIIRDIQKGTEEIHKEVWLCRCGKSSHKPFCDDSHKRL